MCVESLIDGNPDIQKCCNTSKAIRCNIPGDDFEDHSGCRIPMLCGRGPHSMILDVTFRVWDLEDPDAVWTRASNPGCRIPMLYRCGPHPEYRC